MCIVLELCAYGSLSYVLRGDMGDVFDSNDKASVGAMRLSMRDRIFLALGCARCDNLFCWLCINPLISYIIVVILQGAGGSPPVRRWHLA